MKRIIRISVIVLLVVLATLTFVSRTVYNRNLPRVSTVDITMGYVPLIHTYDVMVSTQGYWSISEMLVYEGMDVDAGDVLFLFDTREFDLERRAVELDIRRLENTDDDDLTEYELALAQERLDFLISQSPPEYGLIATTEGQVLNINTSVGQTAKAGVPLLIIRNEIEESGTVFPFIAPYDAIFYLGQGNYVVYAINTRRGILGAEDYITAIQIDIIRGNGRLAAIESIDDFELGGLTLVRDISGMVSSGDTVWIRER